MSTVSSSGRGLSVRTFRAGAAVAISNWIQKLPDGKVWSMSARRAPVESGNPQSKGPVPILPGPLKKDGTQARGREARATILEAAEAVFAEQGFKAASLDEIGRRAAMSKHRMLHYFPSKRALYEAVVAQLMDFVGDMVALYDDDRGSRFAALDLWIDKLAERPTLSRLSLFEMAAPPAEDSPRSFAPFGEQITAAFEEVFRKLVPKAESEECLHFISAIQGVTLLYAASLNEAFFRGGRAHQRRMHERHRELVRSTANHLLSKISASSHDSFEKR